jgi:predicted PurR-regulated permease PerM
MTDAPDRQQARDQSLKERPRWQRSSFRALQAGFWLTVILVVSLLGLLVSDILVPFVIGAVVAYFMQPSTRWLVSRGVPRAVGAAILLALIMGMLAGALAFAAPIILTEIADLLQRAPQILTQIKDVFGQGSPSVFRSASEQTEELLSDAATAASENREEVLSGLYAGVSGLTQLALFWVVMPVVAFYLLMDWDRLIRTLDEAIPRHHLGTVRRLAADIDAALAGFVRGQALVCAILAVYYASVLSILGLNYGFAIGVTSGLISFIPYVGAILGGALAIGVAMWHFWTEPHLITAVVALYAFGQVLEQQILVPKLIGDSVKLHPLWLVFAVLALGSLFGFVGALLSVPLAAVLGVLVRHGYARYRGSSLFAPRPDDHPVL